MQLVLNFPEIAATKIGVMTVPLLWPVQVKPYPDETVITWFARLAWANHCSVDDLLDVIGAKRPSSVRVQPKDIEWHALREHLKGQAEGFPQRLPDRLAEFFVAYYQAAGIERLKVCTACVQAHGAVTYRMQAIYTLACTEHGVLMRSMCSHCGEVLKIVLSSVSDTRGCASCGAPYSTMPVEAAPDALLHYQEQLNREAWSGALDYANFQELAFRFGDTQRFMDIFESTAARLRASNLHDAAYQRRTALLFALSEIVGRRTDLYSASPEVFAGEFGYLVTSYYGHVRESQMLRRRVLAAIRQSAKGGAAEIVTPPPTVP